jgi:phosphoglycolate/pyridoxal phosphate phosphatase family enzyme
MAETWNPEDIDWYETFLFDCDGVLWRGDEPIPGVAPVVNQLREQGKQILFMSNNSTKSRKQYLSKMKSMNIRAEPNEIFHSAYTTARFLLQHPDFDPKTQMVVVIGEHGLLYELREAGLIVMSTHHLNQSDFSCVHYWNIPKNVGAIVVGYDRFFNFAKCTYALRCLQENPNALFISTNQDTLFPYRKVIIPGAGSMVAMLKNCFQREPINMGKPNTWAFQIAAEEFKIDPKHTLVIGDKLNTDIALGKRVGASTLLVSTGVGGSEKDEGVEFPDYTLSSVANLIKL